MADGDFWKEPNPLTGKPRIWDSSDNDVLVDAVDACIREAFEAYIASLDAFIHSDASKFGGQPYLAVFVNTKGDIAFDQCKIGEDIDFVINERWLDENEFDCDPQTWPHWERIAKFILARIDERRKASAEDALGILLTS